MQYKQDNTIKGSIDRLVQSRISKSGMTSYEARVILVQEQYSDPQNKDQIIGDITAGVRTLEVRVNDNDRRDNTLKKIDKDSPLNNIGAGSSGSFEPSDLISNDGTTKFDGVNNVGYEPNTSASEQTTDEPKATLEVAKPTVNTPTQTDGTQNVSNLFLQIEHMDANGQRVKKFVKIAHPFQASPAGALKVYASSYDMKNQVVSTDVVSIGLAGNSALGLFPPPGLGPGENHFFDNKQTSFKATDYDGMIEYYCSGTNVPPALAKAILRYESGGDPNAVSSAGAQGLMQLMGPTAKEMADKLGLSSYDITNPETNIKFSIMYLDELMDRYGRGENWYSVVAGYNAGPGGGGTADVDGSRGNEDVTYVRNVLAQFLNNK